MNIYSKTINKCNIYFEICNLVIKDYYNHILYLIESIALNTDKVKTIYIGVGVIPYELQNVDIKILINQEHTLVRRGGRDLQNAQPGLIKDIFNLDENYLVRLDNYQNLSQANIVIDYSIPNIHNVNTSMIYNEYQRKLVYVPALLYPLDTHMHERTIDTLTTFINTEEQRRKKLLSILTNHLNISNCFDKESLRELYTNTKILINIHQTDEHHTLEELRVLPALLCGVIIISEESPLIELVPYSKYIIWCSYDKIKEKISNVQSNYKQIWEDTFINSSIKDDMNELYKINYSKLNNKICEEN